jgi:hypothetical protein
MTYHTRYADCPKGLYETYDEMCRVEDTCLKGALLPVALRLPLNMGAPRCVKLYRL